PRLFDQLGLAEAHLRGQLGARAQHALGHRRSARRRHLHYAVAEGEELAQVAVDRFGHAREVSACPRFDRYAGSPAMSSAICGRPSTSLASPARRTAPGIPNTTAVSCDSAMTVPPASRIARAPSTPSSPMPVKITPTHFDPPAAAALLRRRSALGT